MARDRLIWLASSSTAMLLLCIAFGWVVVSLYELHAAGTTMAAPEPELSLPTPPKPPEPVSAPNSAIFDLFGNPNSADLVELEPESLPETTLALTLAGTFVHDDPARSSALIALPGEPGVHYYPGDRLSNGAEVRFVRPGAVILKLDNTLQSLYFPHQQEQP